MSEHEQETAPENFIPNPSKVAKAYDAVIEETAQEHAPAIAAAKDQLSESKAAATWLARRRQFKEERTSIDEQHTAAQKVIEAQSKVISTQLGQLLQKESKLESGALKKAKIRAQAKAQALHDEIEELTELRNVLEEIVDLGIEVPHVDVNFDGVVDEEDTAALDADGNGVLDVNDIAAIDARIEELQSKVTDDPVLNLLTKQIEAIHSGVEARQTQLDEAKGKLAEDKQAHSSELKDKKTEIDDVARATVAAHRAEFNIATGAKNEAVAEVQADKSEAVDAEKADLSEYRSNQRASFSQRISNTWDGIVEGLQKAWETTVAGNAQTTAGEEANQDLLERRRAAQAEQGGIIKKKQP